MLVPSESSSAVLAMISGSLCLSASVLTLDEPIVVKLRFLRGYPFDAIVRGESPHPVAPNYLIRN